MRISIRECSTFFWGELLVFCSLFLFYGSPVELMNATVALASGQDSQGNTVSTAEPDKPITRLCPHSEDGLHTYAYVRCAVVRGDYVVEVKCRLCGHAELL
jgi:hypothetical protein